MDGPLPFMSTMSPTLYVFKYVDKCSTPVLRNFFENRYLVPLRLPCGLVIFNYNTFPSPPLHCNP